MNFLCPPATCQSRCLQKKKKGVFKSLFDSLPPRRPKQKVPGRFRNIVQSWAPKARITSYTHEKQMDIYIFFFTRCKRWCNEINNPSNSKKRRTKNKDYPKKTRKEHNLQNSFSQPNPQPRCIKIDDKLKINNSRSLVRFHKSTDRSYVNAMPNAWSVPKRTWLCFLWTSLLTFCLALGSPWPH